MADLLRAECSSAGKWKSHNHHDDHRML